MCNSWYLALWILLNLSGGGLEKVGFQGCFERGFRLYLTTDLTRKRVPLRCASKQGPLTEWLWFRVGYFENYCVCRRAQLSRWGVYGQELSHVGLEKNLRKSCCREYIVCSRFWSGQAASGAIAREEEHGHVSAPWGQASQRCSVLFAVCQECIGGDRKDSKESWSSQAWAVQRHRQGLFLIQL